LKHVPASLTLGGYDANRFESHNVSFDLDPNQNAVAAINEITVSARPLSTSNTGTGWSTNPLTLLGPGDADLFSIDSSTPFIWLPETVCTRFEKALGLVYDTNLQLYTFGNNASQHQALINWNMTFNFAIADLPGSAKVVNISLPYSAFDLQLSYPFPGLNATSSSPTTNYFPLRKAANSSQYTIGRSFLQEAYLIVDYERNNFSVHQATFAIDALTNYDLVNINKPDNSTLTGHSATTGSSLSNGAIAGIVIACVIIVVGLVALLVFCLRKLQNSERDEKQARKKHGLHWFSRKPKEEPLNELLGATHHPVEVPANPKIVELEASTPHELQGSDVVKENVHVSRAPQPRGLTLMLPYDHDPKHPVELHYDNGPRREYYGPEPSPLTPPAYSPSRVGRRENPHATSGEVSRESSPMTTPGLSPSTPMLPISPQAHIIPQMGMGGNRHMYRNEGRGIRCTEEGAGDVTVAQPPVSAVGEVRQYQRYSWEDER